MISDGIIPSVESLSLSCLEKLVCAVAVAVLVVFDACDCVPVSVVVAVCDLVLVWVYSLLLGAGAIAASFFAFRFSIIFCSSFTTEKAEVSVARLLPLAIVARCLATSEVAFVTSF